MRRSFKEVDRGGKGALEREAVREGGEVGDERVGEGRGGGEEGEGSEGLEAAPCFVGLVGAERGEEGGFERGPGVRGRRGRRRRKRRRGGRGGGVGRAGFAEREDGGLEEGVESGDFVGGRGEMEAMEQRGEREERSPHRIPVPA